MNDQFKSSFIKLETEIAAGKQVYGIFGSPISHSLSPLMHNSAFSLLNMNSVYIPFKVDKDELKSSLQKVTESGISGLNITIPLKEQIIGLLDDISDEAKKIGSVNTILFKNGKLKGFNTDINGFLLPLNDIAEPIKYENVVVFGSGGAARTILFAILQKFSFPRLTLISIEKDQSNNLLDEAEYWRNHGTILEYVDFNDSATAGEAIWDSRLVINCTPLGMVSFPETFPVTLSRFLRPGQVVYDLVYNPVLTSFLSAGEKNGAQTINGLSMFIGQGAESFRIWTGKTMPVDKIKDVLEAHFKENS